MKLLRNIISEKKNHNNKPTTNPLQENTPIPSPIDTKIQQGLKSQSKLISIIIRNAMEDFHSNHLSDEQMKELNPIIRNAVYTALFTMQYCNESVRAREFINSQMEMIPGYWEEPELIGGVGE